MFIRWFNWRTLLAFAAIIIIGSSIIYSNYLAKKITADEQAH